MIKLSSLQSTLSSRHYIKAVLTWNMSMLFWCRWGEKYFSWWKHWSWLLWNLNTNDVLDCTGKKPNMGEILFHFKESVRSDIVTGILSDLHFSCSDCSDCSPLLFILYLFNVKRNKVFSYILPLWNFVYKTDRNCQNKKFYVLTIYNFGILVISLLL